MKKILLSAFAIFAMMACNNEEPVRLQEQSLITFEDSFVEAKTRAAVDPSITTTSIDAFDVWGFINQPSGVVFDAERVTKSEDGGWGYTNLQYWMPDKFYYFHAVAPVDDANIVVDTKEMNTAGLGTISFTNDGGTTDLIYASKHVPTGSDVINNAPAPVELKFMHLLSKIKFTFTNGFPKNTSLKVTDIKITNAPAKGSVAVNKEREDFSWNLVQGETTELAFGDVNGGEALASLASDECAAERLTIPADATRNYKITFTLELFYGDQSAGVSNKEVTLENQEFAIGKNYNITATIDRKNFYDEELNPIEFTVVEVEKWDESVINGNIHDDESTNPEQPEQPAEPEVLAKPVVESTVADNVVTLTWEAVEGANAYSVQVDDDVEETVEGTSYTFTGDYGVTYTFTIKALPANEETHKASEATVVTVEIPAQTTPEPEIPAAGSALSVADFLALANAENEYQLTGVITRVVNTTYGNFDLTDTTGTIYIYGLVTPEGAEKTQWAAAGLRMGDTITIKGKYSLYNDEPQISKAVYVSHVPAPFVEAIATTVEAAETTASIPVSANVAWSVTCDAAWVTSFTQNGENNGAIEVAMEANESEENRVANFTLTADGLEAVVVKLTQKGKPAAGVVVGGNSDFATLTNSSSYGDQKTTNGWVGKNCAVMAGGSNDSNPVFKTMMGADSSVKGMTMNGKTSAVGTITSPTISTGCGTLKFKYGYPFSESNGVKFKVEIKQNGAVVETYTINEPSATKLKAYEYEAEVNVSGEFQIVFTNLSPSNSTSNKDRYTIWDVEWTGCN
ncbi:MAG: hypothetical protein IKY74_03785 [Alistipes sp.]|nr:hypothetical protein [Alistipes sp.]